MITRRCWKCKKIKPLEEFTKCKGRPLGYSYGCKPCSNKYHAEWLKTKAGKECYERGREKKKITNDRYFQSEKGKEMKRRAAERSRERNPARYQAGYKLRYAVKAGKVEKLPCEVCKTTENVHGHHEDYSKPLDVIWLCQKHHAERHPHMQRSHVDL